jgi:hypothetical protein
MEKRVLGKLTLIFSLVVFFIGFISATNLGYIYEKDFNIDFKIIEKLDSLGIDVFLLNSKDLQNVNFSQFDVLLIGDERIRNVNKIPLDKPLILMNSYYGKDFGFLEKGKVSKLSSNRPLQVSVSSFSEVYEVATYEVGKSALKYYYLPNKYKVSSLESVAKTSLGYHSRMGDVVAYLPGDKCFFGIVESEYWTSSAEEFFENCVSFVLENVEEPEEPVEEPEEPVEEPEEPVEEPEEPVEEGVHDVAISDLKIKNSENELVENNIFIGGESYKVLIDVENLGNFYENVSFEGIIKMGEEVFLEFSHVAVNDFEPEDKKNDKVKTISLDLSPGNYELVIEGIIEIDDFPENNVVSMNLEII